MADSGRIVWPRLIAAVLAASLCSPLPFSFALVATTYSDFSLSLIALYLGRLFGLSLFISAFAFPVTVAIGLPWHALLQARGVSSVHAYWTTGLIVGAVVGAGLITIITTQATPVLFGAAAGAVSGTSAGFVFWLVRRPDRDFAPTQAVTYGD